MNQKIFIIGILSSLLVGGLIAYLSFDSGFERGFDAGKEWERNIILEYTDSVAHPPLDCNPECQET